MNKIAMIFQEDEMINKDLSHPELGNPGIGGTAFCFLLLCRYLQDYAVTNNSNSKISADNNSNSKTSALNISNPKNNDSNISNPDNKLDMTVYQIRDNILPWNKVKKVETVKDALKKAKEDGCQIVLMRNHQTDEVYENMHDYNFKYIIWMHNKLTYQEIRMFSKWEDIKRIICVGREMYDYYLDDCIIKKMDYAINMFVAPPKDKIRADKYEPIVSYMGSLSYDKNFHILALAWKNILKEVPNAKLEVIGSGKLYDPNSKMGSYGLADAEYEALFMPGLCDDKGKLLDNVIFHGILGEEKYDVFARSAVGVVNPMATETFCLAAIEMESCGIPVVSRRKNGLLDTVEDGKSGILYKKADQLSTTIIRLLKDTELNKKMGKEAASFARSAFEPEKIIPEWIRIFNELSLDKTAKYYNHTANLDNNGKWLRKIIHGVHRFPLLNKLPSIHDLQKK